MKNQTSAETWGEETVIFKRNIFSTIFFFIIIAALIYLAVITIDEFSINSIFPAIMVVLALILFWWLWSRRLPVMADDQGIKFGKKPKISWSSITKYTDVKVKNTFGIISITTSRYLLVRFIHPSKNRKKSKYRVHRSEIANYSRLLHLIDSHM